MKTLNGFLFVNTRFTSPTLRFKLTQSRASHFPVTAAEDADLAGAGTLAPVQTITIRSVTCQQSGAAGSTKESQGPDQPQAHGRRFRSSGERIVVELPAIGLRGVQQDRIALEGSSINGS
mgnify:CR=1 FL=1